MNDLEFEMLCHSLNLPEKGKQLAKQVRSSELVRTADKGGRSVPTRFASKKMKVTIWAESRRVALAGVREYENDEDMLEFFDKPVKIKLNYMDRNGKNQGVMHTPDYFVIRKVQDE